MGPTSKGAKGSAIVHQNGRPCKRSPSRAQRRSDFLAHSAHDSFDASRRIEVFGGHLLHRLDRHSAYTLVESRKVIEGPKQERVDHVAKNRAAILLSYGVRADGVGLRSLQLFGRYRLLSQPAELGEQPIARRVF